MILYWSTQQIDSVLAKEAAHSKRQTVGLILTGQPKINIQHLLNRWV
jgi:hypothetical protein